MSESHVKEIIGQRRRCAIFAVLIDILASSFPKKRHDHASSTAAGAGRDRERAAFRVALCHHGQRILGLLPTSASLAICREHHHVDGRQQAEVCSWGATLHHSSLAADIKKPGGAGIPMGSPSTLPGSAHLASPHAFPLLPARREGRTFRGLACKRDEMPRTIGRDERTRAGVTTVSASQTSPASTDAFAPFGVFAPAMEYMVDAAQRSVLFWDVMRQRGNQYREHQAETAPHVLDYEVELLIDGRRLDRPVNYGPRESGPAVDRRARSDAAESWRRET